VAKRKNLIIFVSKGGQVMKIKDNSHFSISVIFMLSVIMAMTSCAVTGTTGLNPLRCTDQGNTIRVS